MPTTVAPTIGPPSATPTSSPTAVPTHQGAGPSPAPTTAPTILEVQVAQQVTLGDIAFNEVDIDSLKQALQQMCSECAVNANMNFSSILIEIINLSATGSTAASLIEPNAASQETSHKRPHSYDYSAFSSKYEKLQARRAAMFRRSADTVLMEDTGGTSVEYSVTYVGYNNQKAYVDLSQLTDNINTAASSTGSSGLCSQMSATGAQSCTSSLVTMSAVVATAAPTTGAIILRRNTNDSSSDDSGIMIGLVMGCFIGVTGLGALIFKFVFASN